MISRFTRAEVLAADDTAHTVDLRIFTYNTVDSFGTRWEPGCADQSLAEGYLPFAFSHSWEEPIGHMDRVVTNDSTGPVVRFAFDDFNDVPRARQVYSQLKSGTLRDCSIGFSGWTRRDPSQEELAQAPELRDVVSKVDLDEVSIVLHGAVPGAELVGLRMDEQMYSQLKAGTLRECSIGFSEPQRSVGAEELEDDGAPPDEIDVSVRDWSAVDSEIDATLRGLGL